MNRSQAMQDIEQEAEDAKSLPNSVHAPRS